MSSGTNNNATEDSENKILYFTLIIWANKVFSRVEGFLFVISLEDGMILAIS